MIPTTAMMMFWSAVKLAIVAVVLLYSILVLSSYASEGPRCSPHFDLTDPAHSIRDLMVWLGVKVLSEMMCAGRWVLDLLYESSADVGSWLIAKSSAQVQAKVRSRFL